MSRMSGHFDAPPTLPEVSNAETTAPSHKLVRSVVHKTHTRSRMIRYFILILLAGLFLVIQMQFRSMDYYPNAYFKRVVSQLPGLQEGWVDRGNGIVRELEVNTTNSSGLKVARILWWTSFWQSRLLPGVNTQKGVQQLLSSCNKRCEIRFDKKWASSSHAVIFHAFWMDMRQTVRNGSVKTRGPIDLPKNRSEDQIYVLYLSEAPVRDRMDLEPYSYFFNWTMTHRQDADFPNTYGRFYKKSKQESKAYNATFENAEILKEKTDLVAWAASNCYSAPSWRNNLVKELRKHVRVDVYGSCGNMKCKRGAKECHQDLGRRYKFYLAFENSRCKDYVTEKFFDSLVFNTVPVVYGGANYGLRFPAASFINVDSFASAKSLAQYLKYLDENDDEYVKYFAWKKHYTVESKMRPQKIWCDLCERLHLTYKKRRYLLNAYEFLFNNRTGHNPVCTSPHQFV